jgi:hypothetical protein
MLENLPFGQVHLMSLELMPLAPLNYGSCKAERMAVFPSGRRILLAGVNAQRKFRSRHPDRRLLANAGGHAAAAR